jgi:two-component system, NarL family, sensor histidine kinase DesK
MSTLHRFTHQFKISGRMRDVGPRALLMAFSSMWVLQLLFPWWDFWRAESSTGTRLVVTVLVLAFIAAYGSIFFRTYFHWTSRIGSFRERERWGLRAVLAGIATVLVLWQGDSWALTTIFLVIGTVMTGPPKDAYQSALAALAFSIIVMAVARVETDIFVAVLAFSFIFGFLIASHLRQSGIIGEIMESRYAAERIAATEERLRIARELHDVLGRTLSLITLKSELAGKLIDGDPGRARQEIQDVESLARSAMSDVRQTISHTRRPNLSAEIEDARQLLAAAGITLDVQGEKADIPDEIATLLAWGVREGVTNVVRHSEARRCMIVIRDERDTVVLSITDNGNGSTDGTPNGGSGLSGLHERVTQLNGQLTFETLPEEKGHRLSMTVPREGDRQG